MIIGRNIVCFPAINLQLGPGLADLEVVEKSCDSLTFLLTDSACENKDKESFQKIPFFGTWSSNAEFELRPAYLPSYRTVFI